MWQYEKRLQYPVNIKEPNAKIAKITLEKLNKVGANVIGIILNKFSAQKYSYYNSYYGYSGYYDDKPKRGLFKRKKHKKHKKK